MASDRTERADEYPGSLDAVEAAFASLADETRMQILLELTKVVRERGTGAGLPFSELRERVGIDDSGRFNYHLDKLSPVFVRKVGDEHVARYPGLLFISTVLAGTHRDAESPETQTAETELACSVCGESLELHYAERPHFTGISLSCPEHGEMDEYPVPPGALSGRLLSELMTVGYTHALTNLDLARRGICGRCWGTASVAYPADVDADTEHVEEFIYSDVRCDRCWYQLVLPLRTLVATQPMVLAAFEKRGYDLLEATSSVTTVGESAICRTELRDDDPPEAAVEIAFDDGTLRLIVDEGGTVASHEWT